MHTSSSDAALILIYVILMNIYIFIYMGSLPVGTQVRHADSGGAGGIY